MSLTLLLDLDDTLLINNIDEFLPHYLAAYSAEVAPYVDPEQFVKKLLTGTRQMIANRSPECTLREVFEAHFFSDLGIDHEAFQPLADRFYTQVFPSLREFTRPKPEAIHLVDESLERGYRLVIATNPLFPATAIQQRLEWAQLPPEKYPFELITSFESFHFGKPDPAYFAEIMARVGWPKGPVIMVGDDLERDIIASRRMGLAAFWISRDGENPTAGLEAPSGSGALEDVLPWIDRTSPDDLVPDFAIPSAMLSILRSTPAALDNMCRHLPGHLFGQRPEAGEWCISEVLCHMRDVDVEVNLPRLRTVLGVENPFIPGVDTDPWAEERNYIQQDGARALQNFMVARGHLVNFLESIEPGDWNRPSRHAIFGPTHFYELVGIIAAHDRLHIRQVRKVLDSISGIH